MERNVNLKHQFPLSTSLDLDRTESVSKQVHMRVHSKYRQSVSTSQAHKRFRTAVRATSLALTQPLENRCWRRRNNPNSKLKGTSLSRRWSPALKAW